MAKVDTPKQEDKQEDKQEVTQEDKQEVAQAPSEVEAALLRQIEDLTKANEALVKAAKASEKLEVPSALAVVNPIQAKPKSKQTFKDGTTVKHN